MEKITLKNELDVVVYYNGVPKVANMPQEFLEMFAGCLEEKIYLHYQKKLQTNARRTTNGTKI